MLVKILTLLLIIKAFLEIIKLSKELLSKKENKKDNNKKRGR